ncbi:MAG: sodium:solute symporter family protein [Synergistetes bacterium]|nr:sodium:solute symporter family protein [Synergistota bacterium]
MSSIGWLIAVVGSYMAVVLAIGFIGYKRTKATAEDYYLGSRGLGTIVLSGTLIATYASLWTFLGAVGGNYRAGLSFVSMMLLWNLTWPLMVWFIGTKVWLLGKKYGYITYSELINDYYESKWLGIIASIMGILALLPYISVQLMGGGIAIETFTNGAISFSTGVTITFVFMVLVIAMAGVRSVVWTDTFQGIFFLSVMLGIALYAMHLGGGFEGVFRKVSQNNPALLKPGKIKFGMWIGFVLTWGFAVLLPHMFQRLMMAKDPRTISKVTIASSILSGWVQTIPVFLLGIACTILIPGIKGKATDSITILFSAKYLPPYIAALVVGGAFAAGTSTLNSQLLTTSSLVLRDLIQNPSRKKLSPTKETFYGRAIVLVLGLTVLFIALLRPGLIVPISTAGTAICISGYMYPLLGVLFWPRAGKISAYASMITSGTTSILTWLAWPFPLGIYNVLWGLMVGGIAFVVTTLLSPPPPKQRINRFHELIKYV